MEYVTGMGKPQSEEETIIQQWASESIEFSRHVKKLLDEFGFNSQESVKHLLQAVFPKDFIKYRSKHYSKWCDMDIVAVRLAKALLVASALQETNNLKKLIEWAYDD